MPNFPIVDTHVHLWDPTRLPYSWLQNLPALDRPHLVEDYREACGPVQVEAMVFLECDVDASPDGRSELAEIEFVMTEVAREPRIRGIVPSLPLERGAAVVAPILAQFSDRFPLVRGVRRLIQSMPDAKATLSSDAFREAIKLLPDHGYHFELCCQGSQLDDVIAFASDLPDVSFILDHCGKPLIRAGEIAAYRRQMSELAALPNVVCKLSDLPVEADPAAWTPDDLRPYVETVVEAFGASRLMFGGDWPVLLQAATLPRWIHALDELLSPLGMGDRRAIFHGNANAFYRLGL